MNEPTGKTFQEHAAASQLQRLQVELEQRVGMIHSAWVEGAARGVEQLDETE